MNFSVKSVTVHGIRYASDGVIRVKNTEEAHYAVIKHIYIYKDFKIFHLESLRVIQYSEHMKAVMVKRTVDNF